MSWSFLNRGNQLGSIPPPAEAWTCLCPGIPGTRTVPLQGRDVANTTVLGLEGRDVLRDRAQNHTTMWSVTPWCESWCGFPSAREKEGGGNVCLLTRTCQSLLTARLTFPPKEREEREKESLIPLRRGKREGRLGSNNS